MDNGSHRGVIISGTSQPEFAKAFARAAGIPLLEVAIESFPDNETRVTVEEDLYGKVVFACQTICYEPDHYLVELLLLLDAIRRYGPEKIVAVIPYFGYGRQDRQDRPGVPVAARLVADLLEKAGANAIMTADLHAEQIEGFFRIPVVNHVGIPLLGEEIKKRGIDDLVVVAPDIGSVKIARKVSRQLGCGFVVVNKHRTSPTQVGDGMIIGDVRDRNVLLADDMCSTGETLLSAAKACREKGAKSIYVAVTHGLFVADAMEKIEASPIEHVWVSDTIPWAGRFPGATKCTSVSFAPPFAKTALRFLS